MADSSFLKNKATIVAGVILILAGLWAVTKIGGAPEGPATFTPSTISGALPKASVIEDAKRWVGDNPARYWALVNDTGSMKPFFDHHSLLLVVRYVGQGFPNGTVAIFDRGDTKNMVHVVVDQNETHVYMSGVNNHDSDGWFPRTVIRGLVVGQLYLP